MGFCNYSMFCCALLLRVLSSFAIILMGKSEMVALLCLSSCCLVIIVWLFLMMPWVCLQFVIVYLLIILTIFQRQLSIINFTLNYPPIRNILTSASLLSMLIETDYLNYPPIRINLTSATHRTTSCFDDRLLTMMTDTGFYVP